MINDSLWRCNWLSLLACSIFHVCIIFSVICINSDKFTWLKSMFTSWAPSPNSSFSCSLISATALLSMSGGTFIRCDMGGSYVCLSVSKGGRLWYCAVDIDGECILTVLWRFYTIREPIVKKCKQPNGKNKIKLLWKLTHQIVKYRINSDQHQLCPFAF